MNKMQVPTHPTYLVLIRVLFLKTAIVVFNCWMQQVNHCLQTDSGCPKMFLLWSNTHTYRKLCLAHCKSVIYQTLFQNLNSLLFYNQLLQVLISQAYAILKLSTKKKVLFNYITFQKLLLVKIIKDNKTFSFNK